jgi:hypothetical protein
MRKKFLTVFILVWLAAVPSLAAVIDAGAWAEFYAYKVKFPQTQSQFRALEGLRMGVRNAFIPGLSIFARGRVASDLSKKLPSDPDLRIFGAYLEYAVPRNWLIARAGRQFVYAGLGAVTLDGAKFDLMHKGFTLTGYAGSTPGLSFYDLDEVSSWKKSNAYGGRLKYAGHRNLMVGASFQQRNFDNNLDSELGGLDFSYSHKICNIFGRADYDFFFKKLSLLIIRPSLKTASGHSLNLEYLYHRPSLPLHDMFSVFNGKPYHEVRLSPVIKFKHDIYGLGSLTYTKYKGDDNTRFSLGASYLGQSAGFMFSDGYGGRQIGGFANVTYCPMKKLQLYLHGDSFNYKINKDDSDYTPSLAAALGGYLTLMDGLQTRAEAQLLSNRDYKYDTRFYLRIEYSLRHIVGETMGGDVR